jgi:hypothetical protein
MDKIEDIKRIKVDLLKLKPIEDQKNVYESYKKFLAQYFVDDSPDEKYFTSINCPLCASNNERTLVEIDSFVYIRCGHRYNISTALISGSPSNCLEENITEVCVNQNFFHTVEVLSEMTFYQLIHGTGNACPTIKSELIRKYGRPE